MNGSRHEKAAILALSYVIGFVTAFILYTDLNITAGSTAMFNGSQNGAAVVTATPQATAPAKAEEDNSLNVSYQKGVLFASLKGNDTILSFNPETSGLLADISTLEQGYHYSKPSFRVSSDEKFVYFCESHTLEDTTCAAFVYDVNADRIYPVTDSGVQVVLTQDVADSVIWTALGLKVEMSFSANPSAPWILIAGE
jgi:hypothetical protein